MKDEVKIYKDENGTIQIDCPGEVTFVDGFIPEKLANMVEKEELNISAFVQTTNKTK